MWLARVWFTIVITCGAVFPVSGQLAVEANKLLVGSVDECAALQSRFRGKKSGGQWLIGDGIKLYGRPNGQVALRTLPDGSFQRVQCLSEVSGGQIDRVFVQSVSGGSCGWVDRSKLLSENEFQQSTILRQRRAVCEIPRAMMLEDYCRKLARLGASDESSCEGVPQGLRAKGVLKGSSAVDDKQRFRFYSAPRNGQVLGTRTFFSVLEIHDLDFGPNEEVMILVGDGEGDMFGWINREAIELWPTRLGVFYDANGVGGMFQRQRDLFSNWRLGTPAPDVVSGMTKDEAYDYVHGNLQLLSYPIVRTILSDATNGSDSPSYHEVIFLGQTGEGSAAQLLSEAALANRQEQLSRVNIMLVMDSTESMRPYLPLITKGIKEFVLGYQVSMTDPENKLPALRLGVFAYSDFQKRNRTNLDDPITIQALVPPTRIDPNRDINFLLSRVSSHEGLNDVVGLREEAALEAVAQLSDTFAQDKAWFDDGPRIIIHIADHGSRDDKVATKVLERLKKNGSFYLPIVVTTRDATQSSARARRAFERQAVRMSVPIVDKPTLEDVARIDLSNFESETPKAVRKQLDLVVLKAVSALAGTRNDLSGSTVDQSSRKAEDRLSSRIKLDEALREQFGLSDISKETIAKAGPAFVPLQVRSDGIVEDVQWSYTISLEPVQAKFLARNFEAMCRQVGSPEQSSEFKKLLIRVAETFSGDVVKSDAQIRGILSDMNDLPGASQSFLSQRPDVLISKADSTDPALVDELKRDVCWISYHLGNYLSGVYARPDQLVWTGREFRLASGQELIKRQYRYKPLVGADTVYLPSFFFVLPSILENQSEISGKAPCIFC